MQKFKLRAFVGERLFHRSPPARIISSPEGYRAERRRSAIG